jgi:hypothetical protein
MAEGGGRKEEEVASEGCENDSVGVIDEVFEELALAV